MRITALFITLSLALSVHADDVALRDTAPDAHTVVKGDTLWGISAKFLKDPWKWPEVWQLNKEQIRNPHLIYPGDVIRLIRGEQPQLVLERGMPTVRLSPQVRAEPLVTTPESIPSIPHKAIAPFLNRGGVMDPDGLASAPRILGTTVDRVILSAHDVAYAEPGPENVKDWQIVRQGPALKDPISGEVLGYEMVYMGEARTVQPGTPQLIRILHSNQEVLERDRLMPLAEVGEMSFVPRAPDKPVSARVLAALGGVEGAGPYTTVVLNQGANGGLEVGHVLGIFKAGRTIADPKCLQAQKLSFLSAGIEGKSDCVPNAADTTALPERRIGLMFVYRVFERVSYALIMSSAEPVYVLDTAKNP